ncbi:MAG: 50S ribosome-binding GTPase, partial [Planctomycetes bacterium]|nr:50S ribosome-binding GTPase [Planctomycetota bacterium]
TKAGGKRVDVFHVPKSGAGQVVLLGMPNSGKSALVGALTNAKVQVTDFPFATHAPVPGMVHYQDVPIQLVDMPPITADFVAPGQVGTYRHADMIGLVIDLSADIEEQWQVGIDYLESKSLITQENAFTRDEHGNSLTKPFFCLGTKVDLAGEGLLDLLAESTVYRCEFLELSTSGGPGLEGFPEKLFDWLKIVRIYAKPPGKPADMKDPFTLAIGATVHDLTRLIHRELADKLKTARCWGTGVYDGQNVHLTHVLHDRDVVELHFT